MKMLSKLKLSPKAHARTMQVALVGLVVLVGLVLAALVINRKSGTSFMSVTTKPSQATFAPTKPTSLEDSVLYTPAFDATVTVPGEKPRQVTIPPQAMTLPPGSVLVPAGAGLGDPSGVIGWSPGSSALA